ncbi:glycosyltransferase [Acetobacter sp.]|jgi:glycosyltransferase involved in cell wall biosynthesis|uniref:glycosyltransferase n=1 Tax=Acetobacter sp. TaxID=440 RepID=UPI0025BB4A0D|nr:glycosyltransferase [Acetobacter sp.]MCH4092607.1 glycosyltransferase [Acetobacter sp.]MCI1299741.1 glycosyltransferase [Acetobacter sp.]MCI1315379.1 glycosyltransferase [Acetobacter sp.]
MPAAPLSSASLPGHVWFDVEDLFEYGRTNTRPSGIQRVAFEIQRAMCSLPGMQKRVGFLRHSLDGRRFVIVSHEEVEALYERLTAQAGQGDGLVCHGSSGENPAPSRLRRVALQLPVAVRVPLGQLVAHQSAVLRDLSALVRGGLATFRQARRQRDAGPRQLFLPASHDSILALGAPWAHPDYGVLINHYRHRYGVTFGLLVHDIIPLLYPEWCPAGLPRVFRRWLASTLPACDQVFSVSQATRNDLERLFPGVTARSIRMGTMKTAGSKTDDAPLAMNRPYVLSVGTLEVRKNHLLLFRLWRRLLTEHRGEDIPQLVLVGSPGWLAEDLMGQLRNSDFLDGYVTLILRPSDTRLDTLYRNALFTIVPSFYEGWGLPVSESLIRGKVCLASDRGALVEAGQGLAVHFDPDNLNDALEKIRPLLFGADTLAEMTQRVEADFRPTAWNCAAQEMLQTLCATTEDIAPIK